jgi:SAM-dependent methyltransferase
MGQLPDAGPDPPVHDRPISISTESSASFQIPIEAAEFYESAFVPTFFAQWAPVLCEAADVRSGQRLLDVACGTGIVARTAAGLVEPDGKVVGLDLNEAMLTVARRVCPDIEFHQGDATALPFPDGSFDVVLCQLALMFFPDRSQALAEMRRVVTAGGTVAVVVPAVSTPRPPSRPSSTWPPATPAPRPCHCWARTSCAAISTNSPYSSSPLACGSRAPAPTWGSTGPHPSTPS